VAQVVKCLPSKYEEALSSNYSTYKNKKNTLFQPLSNSFMFLMLSEHAKTKTQTKNFNPAETTIKKETKVERRKIEEMNQFGL
jgi:hypothetical protein